MTVLLPSGKQRAAIGDKGELWLASRLPSGWFWQPPRIDLGKDGLVVIRDESDLHNLEFSIQVKTSIQPKIRNGSVVISNVSRSSIFYWFSSLQPTLVVAVDLSREVAWYTWHLDLFESPENLPKAASKTVTIRIPTHNTLGPEAWDDIRSRLRAHYRSIFDVMARSESYVWIVASVSVISNALRNLVKLSEKPVPDRTLTKEEGISLLIEQRCCSTGVLLPIDVN